MIRIGGYASRAWVDLKIINLLDGRGTSRGLGAKELWL
jgi:hypothetical protein